MASNSSAAAAFFGISGGDQQDQIKPLISPQQQQLAAALPGVAGAAPAPGSGGQGAPAAAAQPPPKKKRTLPGDSCKYLPFFGFRSCMHAAYVACFEISSGSIGVLWFGCSQSEHLSSLTCTWFLFPFYLLCLISWIVLSLVISCS